MRLMITIVIVLIFGSCNAIKPPGNIITLGSHKWILTAINHKPMSGTANKAWLKFDEDDMEVKGKVFCNSVTAEYELMGKDQLTFDAISSTKMYCEGVMNLESEMVANLRDVRRYEIRNRILYLYGSDTILLTFKTDSSN